MDRLPADNGPPRWRAAKTFLIWGLLIAMVMVLGGEARWAFAGTFVGVFLLIVVPVGIVQHRRARAFLPEANDASTALVRGDLERAEEIFWKWSEVENRIHAAFSRHSLAWTLMRKCELPRAIAVQTENIKERERELIRFSMLPTSMVDLAIFHALQGDLDAADKQLAQLDKRSDLKPNASFPVMNAFTRAVLLCRRGNAAAAAKLLDDKWTEYEAIANGDLLRPMRVVRAFAIASTDLRDAGKAAGVLGDMRPSWHGEFDFLGVEWPEMATFLATHNLATKELASA